MNGAIYDFVQQHYHESEELFWAWLRNTVDAADYEQLRTQPFAFVRQLQAHGWCSFLLFTAWEAQGWIEDEEAEVAYANDLQGVVFSTYQIQQALPRHLRGLIEEQVDLWLEDVAWDEEEDSAYAPAQTGAQA